MFVVATHTKFKASAAGAACMRRSGECGFVLFTLCVPRKAILTPGHTCIDTEEFDNHQERPGLTEHLQHTYGRSYTKVSHDLLSVFLESPSDYDRKAWGRYATGATQSGTRCEVSDTLLNMRKPDQNLV